MYTNGIIVQRKTEDPCGYRGIDGSGFSCAVGENWFLRYEENFEEYYDENIGLTYYDVGDCEWVNACTDRAHIRQYIEEAEKRGIPYRLILCESCVPQPIMEDVPQKKTFLGYDYAYSDGDNYSAVYNEIPVVFDSFRLNENGLFDSEEELQKYLAAREGFVRSHPPHTLEDGGFVIFRLWEIDRSEFMGGQP